MTLNEGWRHALVLVRTALRVLSFACMHYPSCSSSASLVHTNSCQTSARFAVVPLTTLILLLARGLCCSLHASWHDGCLQQVGRQYIVIADCLPQACAAAVQLPCLTVARPLPCIALKQEAADIFGQLCRTTPLACGEAAFSFQGCVCMRVGMSMCLGGQASRFNR